MITINCLIVEIDSEYENEREGVVSNIDRDNTFFITREATVISAPEFTPLQKGDKVICHHNIFRKKGDISGTVIHSSFHIEGKIYHVPLTEVFMFKREDQWEALSPFCFVKPIREEVNKGDLHLSDAEITKETYKGFKKQRGILTHPCKELESRKGSEVIFSLYSEYEFVIDGELYYKMNLNDILAFI